jgi:hypothetical protein
MIQLVNCNNSRLSCVTLPPFFEQFAWWIRIHRSVWRDPLFLKRESARLLPWIPTHLWQAQLVTINLFFCPRPPLDRLSFLPSTINF